MAGLEQLETLNPAVAQPAAAPVHVQKLDAHGRAYATGKRKDAVARVWIKPGKGTITVNGKEFATYFARPVLQMILRQPIIAANRDGQYDVITIRMSTSNQSVKPKAKVTDAEYSNY